VITPFCQRKMGACHVIQEAPNGTSSQPAEPANLSCKLLLKLAHPSRQGYSKMGEDAHNVVVDLGEYESRLLEIYPIDQIPQCVVLANNLKFSHPDLGVLLRTLRRDWFKENCPDGRCKFSVKKLNGKILLVEGQLKEFIEHVRSHPEYKGLTAEQTLPWKYGSWKSVTDWPEHGMGPPPHIVIGV